MRFPNDGGNSQIPIPSSADKSKLLISPEILGNFLRLEQFESIKDLREFIMRQLGRIRSLVQPSRSHTSSLSRYPLESWTSTKFSQYLRYNSFMFRLNDKSGNILRYNSFAKIIFLKLNASSMTLLDRWWLMKIFLSIHAECELAQILWQRWPGRNFSNHHGLWRNLQWRGQFSQQLKYLLIIVFLTRTKKRKNYFLSPTTCRREKVSLSPSVGAFPSCLVQVFSPPSYTVFLSHSSF